MSAPERIVIVGAGQAAAQVIDTLRRKGFRGQLTLVGDEPHLPYQRPPLSKKYLAGAFERGRLPFRHETYYAEHQVDLRLGQPAVEIDRSARRVLLERGASLPYDLLLLATGSVARRLSLPGSEMAGVYTLRSVRDVDSIRDALASSHHIAIVGAGYIGLEVAATFRELGCQVTVLEAADRVMGRVVSASVSRFYESEHAARGVRIVLGASIVAIVGDGRARAVRCVDGSEYPADLVIMGVGGQPCLEVATRAGLACEGGIVVDEYCRTSDPLIFAAGDCTIHPSSRYGARRVRLESVDNAFEQGTTAALNMLGTATVYDKVPWFWSDQYDLKLLIVGLAHDHDEVVLRGDPNSRSFSACYLRNGELLAIETVNGPKDQMAARKLIAARARMDRAKLAESAIPLKDATI